MSKRILVLKRIALFVSVNFLVFTVPKNTHAVADFGNAAVLPVGRFQVTFRFGNVADIQNRFDGGGFLQKPSRMNQRMDNKFLMNVPEFKQLAQIIDHQLLPNQKPSSEMDMGTLEFDGKADVSYFSPQIAMGITRIWSLGVAIPIVKYESDISMRNSGVNTAAEIIEGSNAKFDEADKNLGAKLKMIKGGPKAFFAHALKTNNYREVSARNDSFLGDITFGSSLKLYDTRRVDFYLVNQLVVPTGPKDDPDDLLDLNIFGKTEFQTALFTNYDALHWLELGMGVSYSWGIPDDIEKRVPRSELDKLPPASTKEVVRKDPGDTVGLQLVSMAKISNYWQTGVGYEMEFDTADRYTGSKNSKYELLERDTESESHVVKFKLTYTTIDGFLQGNEKIPYSLTYAFADHIKGVNVERELTNELLMKFYF